MFEESDIEMLVEGLDDLRTSGGARESSVRRFVRKMQKADDLMLAKTMQEGEVRRERLWNPEVG